MVLVILSGSLWFLKLLKIKIREMIYKCGQCEVSISKKVRKYIGESIKSKMKGKSVQN